LQCDASEREAVTAGAKASQRQLLVSFPVVMVAITALVSSRAKKNQQQQSIDRKTSVDGYK
jgi:hypothetical protein